MLYQIPGVIAAADQVHRMGSATGPDIYFDAYDSVVQLPPPFIFLFSFWEETLDNLTLNYFIV